MSNTATITADEVHFGSTVEIEDLSSGRHDSFTLVRSHEANPAEGRLSEASPIARALIGHCAGELAQVQTPRGVRSLRILQVG